MHIIPYKELKTSDNNNIGEYIIKMSHYLANKQYAEKDVKLFNK